MAHPVAIPEGKGPLLHLGAGVVLDCRHLDRIELAERFHDAGSIRLILGLGEVEVSVELDADSGAAEALIVRLAPYTRAAPITSEADYAETEALYRQVAGGSYLTPITLTIAGDPVLVDGDHVSVGMLGYRIDAVKEVAATGGHVELAGSAVVPAAIMLIAVAASLPPALGPIERRLAEYRETRRRRSAPS